MGRPRPATRRAWTRSSAWRIGWGSGCTGPDPDTIIGECVRERDGEKRVRDKGRRRYADLIMQFQSQVEGSRVKRGKWGNTVRSFLIHNGVLLQAGLQGGNPQT